MLMTAVFLGSCVDCPRLLFRMCAAVYDRRVLRSPLVSPVLVAGMPMLDLTDIDIFYCFNLTIYSFRK